MPLRLIFMGTPEFAVPTLRALRGAGHEIVAVYTREAKPAGARHETATDSGGAGSASGSVFPC